MCEKKLFRLVRAASIFTVLAIPLICERPAYAAVQTWANVGTTWASAANWSSSVPSASDVALFNSSSYADDPVISTTASAGALWDTGSGSLTIQGGTLSLSGATVNGHAITGIEVDSAAGGLTIGAALSISNSQIWTNNAASPIDVEGNVSVASRQTLNTSGSGDISISGVVSGAGFLTQNGSGSLTLTGSNTYTGATTVAKGELFVDGSLVSRATVISSALLGGTGSLTSIQVNTGGTLAPGDPGGELQLSGTLTLQSGAKGNYQLGVPADSSEVYMPSGRLALGNQQFGDFNFTPLAGFGPGEYTLIDAGSFSGSLGSGTSGVIGIYPASIAMQGDNLVLTVVPEPGTLALLAISASCGLAVALNRRYAIPCAARVRRRGRSLLV